MANSCKQIVVILTIATLSFTANAQTMIECSRIDDADERVACYDRVAGRVEEKMEEAYPGTTEQRVEARQESIAEVVVGTDEPAPEAMTVEISKIIRDRTRRIVYKTTDGRFYRRSDGSKYTFKVGDKCKLNEGVLGSIFLVREDGKTNKVKELNPE